LRRAEQDDDPGPLADAALDEVASSPDEQLSLFSVLSAHVVGSSQLTTSVFDEGLDEPDDGDGEELDDGTVPIDLPPPPPPGAGRYSMALPEDLGGRSLAEVKRDLRTANADLAMHLVRFTALSHREVNGRLNRLVGIQRIDQASLDELRRRADQAERWIASL
jgi:hypothetical protein